MRSIEGHPDFGILERRLVDLVRAHRAEAGAPASGRAAAGAPLPAGLAPLAIVAPTRRLLAHLRVRLASEFPALLGVHFFHHDSLAHAAANAAGIVLPRSLPDSVKEAILLEAIRAAGGALATYVHDRPGSVAALLASIEDLREAGVDPEAALRAPGLERAGRDLLSLYSAYAARLDRLAARGVSDRSGALRAALPHVRAFGRRFHLVVHYGAYELIGANLALLRALQESGAPLVDLTPFHATAPAYGYARGFWREFVGTLPAEIRSGGPSDRLLGDRLPGLYDEAAEPPPVDTARIELFHAQGAAAELREVALRILALHRDEKIALRDIAVVARTLEPYASLLEPVFSEHGLPFVTTATLGALREARVQATLHLVRCVTGDFERQPLIDLCRSGLLDLKTADAGHAAHEWDRLSREWQVAGGFDVWTRDLPRWLEGWEPWLPDDADAASRAGAALLKEGRLRQARSLAAAVGEMRSAARPLLESSGWQAFSEALRALAGALLGLALDERDDQVLEHGEAAVADALDALRDLELTGAPFDHAGAVAFFERALAAGSVPIAPPGDNGGVRILDAMQARGLACEALFLIGCNADLIPRRPREDPFLPDADRRRLRNHLSVPLPIKSEAIEEEHLLLALLLGSARRRLTLSWQRADEDGRAKVPSLALREVSRLALGAASLGAAEKAALRVKTHPAEAGSDAARRLGLLPPAEARVNIALELRSPRLFLESLPAPPPAGGEEREERLRAGLSNLRVIEEDDAPTGPDLRYDAFIGESIPPSGPWSPSRLEALGACPQHYFFRHLLRVEELQEPAEGYEIDPLDLGRVVHAVLQEVYEGLQAAGHLRGDGIDPEGAVRAAQESVARIWGEKTGRLAARMRPRYPLLFEATSAHWIEALRRFLAEDVARLVRDGARLVGLEKEASASLPLGAAGKPLSLAGRFDRVVRLAAGDLVVSDYKSSRRLREMVDLADILKGSRLQMPLYILLAEAGLTEWGAVGARVRAEVLGVGPAVDPEESRFEVDAEKFARHREGFGETLTVLLDLAATGFYPLNEESRVCGYCPYTRACRRGHAATLERLAAAPGGGDYARLRRKSTRAPTLAEVRGRRIPDAGPEEARGRRPALRPRERR